MVRPVRRHRRIPLWKWGISSRKQYKPRPIKPRPRPRYRRRR